MHVTCFYAYYLLSRSLGCTEHSRDGHCFYMAPLKYLRGTVISIFWWEAQNCNGFMTD